jgi:N-acyl homoserine lactone hydrolase
MGPAPPAVRRIDFGYFVRPADETGTGLPRVEPLLGYAIVRADGVLLFDSGLGEGDAEADARYRPVRRPLPDALRSAGVALDAVRWLANCHLHFDHCGGNPALAGRPIFVQAIELRTARTTTDYTLPQLIDFTGAVYREIDGEVEILPGVRLIPTPGHTAGHQAIAVRSSDGTVVLAGQARDTAFQYSSDQMGWRARHERRIDDSNLSYLPWIERLQQLDPKRVVFAHDRAVWEP